MPEMPDDERTARQANIETLIVGAVLLLAMISLGAAVVIWFLYLA